MAWSYRSASQNAGAVPFSPARIPALSLTSATLQPSPPLHVTIDSPAVLPPLRLYSRVREGIHQLHNHQHNPDNDALQQIQCDDSGQCRKVDEDLAAPELCQIAHLLRIYQFGAVVHQNRRQTCNRNHRLNRPGNNSTVTRSQNPYRIGDNFVLAPASLFALDRTMIPVTGRTPTHAAH